MRIRVLKILEQTTADGPGFRTSVYCAGCRHACKGCHNPESWDFNAGEWMEVDEILDLIKADSMSDVSFSGGDPLYQVDAFTELARRIKQETGKTSAGRVSPWRRSKRTRTWPRSFLGWMSWWTAPSSLHCGTRTFFSAAAPTSASSICMKNPRMTSSPGLYLWFLSSDYSPTTHTRTWRSKVMYSRSNSSSSSL